MEESLIQKINWVKNDYTQECCHYYETLKDHLNSEPYMSYTIPLDTCKQKISVIIPSWNSLSTLLYTLKTISFSNVCTRYGDKLEVIVIDDGSEDKTFEKLQDSSFPFTLKCIKQMHLSRSAAINTGVKASTGELLIFCDADVLLFPKALDELIKRQQIFLDTCIFFGFREDHSREDINFDDLKNFMCTQKPAFWKDNRFLYDYPYGWAKNMMKLTKMLNGRKGNQNFYVSNGISGIDNCWQLFRMVYGFLFSVSRKVFLQVGGFDEKLKGWGWEDSLFVAKCLSIGVKIIPVPSAHCIHIYHSDRSATKWDEAKKNFGILTEILGGNHYRNNMDFRLESRVLDTYISLGNSEKSDIIFNPMIDDVISYYHNLGNFLRLREIIKTDDKKCDEIVLLETALYLKDFTLVENKALPNTYLGALVSFLKSGNFENNIVIDDNSDYFFYFNQLSTSEFLVRGNRYVDEEQYLLSIFDYFAVVLKIYQEKDYWDKGLLDKIKMLYSLHEVKYDLY